MTRRKYIEKLIFCFSGVFFSYLIYGYFHEKLTKTNYNGEKFHCFYILMLFQCITNMIWAYFESYIREDKFCANSVPQYFYLLCGFTYLFAMLTSTTALKWVTYPSQVIGKSIKPIPVMLLGVLFGKKRYSLSKYINVFTITLGVILFMYNSVRD
ncbi:hypothetical protein HZS_2175, partial [Henneguya salminicola]